MEMKGFDNPAFINEENRNGVGKSPAEAKTGPGYDVDDHKIPLEELLRRYATNFTKGLTDSQVLTNREKYGKNELTPPPKPSIVWKFIKAIWGGLNMLLWVCCFLSYLSFGAQYLIVKPEDVIWDNFFLGCSLIVVTHISGLFQFYQEFKSDKIMDSFKNMVPKATFVYRNGKRTEVKATDLVVGDIAEIELGDVIPADMRILECQNFKIDNSSLTGESEPLKSSPDCSSDNPLESKNMALFSTCAVEGVAKGIVVRVGSNTYMGQLASLASSVTHVPSPIEKEMDRFIKIMTLRSLIFGGCFFTLALIMRYTWTDAIFFVIGIVVANVPEGLAITFTMVLSETARRMAKKNCVVKHLHAIEALGSTSVICSDKTGTITQNKMSVAHMWFNNEIAEADTSEYASGVSFDNNDPGFQAIARVAALCSRATFKPGQENVPVIKRLVEGDASETAILKCMENQLGSVARYREKHLKKCEVPFNSTNKFQISIHESGDVNDPRYLLVMKGAPERIISFCSTILIGDQEYDIDDEWKEAFNEAYHDLASYGERVLGFCDFRLPLDRFPTGYQFDADNSAEFLYLGFRFVGLISLIDPPKAAVPDAVAKCRSAGIKVVMVTGDHPVTAAAIARSVGIISEENKTIEELAAEQGVPVERIDPTKAKCAVISGAELKLLSSEELKNVLQNYEEIVFARTSPEQKYSIVEAFQELGNVVAATGDGVNDSPAIKKADIGVAMGISGSEVSKETADMIILNDDFSTIAVGVEEGRLIFDNLKKLVQYNLTDNIAEMYSVMVFVITGVPLPMGTIAMLLSVCVTDCFPAISLAQETAEADIMKIKPRNPVTDNLVTPQLLRLTYMQTSFIELAGAFFSWIVVFWSYGWNPMDLWWTTFTWDNKYIDDMPDSFGQEWTWRSRQELKLKAQTAFFCSIVIMQIGNVLICKTRRMSIFQKGMTNWKLNIGVVVALCLAIFLTSTPGMNIGLQFYAIKPVLWLSSIPFAIYLILYDEVRRLIIRCSKGGFYAKELTT